MILWFYRVRTRGKQELCVQATWPSISIETEDIAGYLFPLKKFTGKASKLETLFVSIF